MDGSVRCFKNAWPRAELLEKASTSWGTEESVRWATEVWEGAGVAGEAGEASENTLLLG